MAAQTQKACDKPHADAKQIGKQTVSDKGAPNSSDHFEPTVRLLKIPKSASGACGFHLTRSKWDPYPWVSGVDADTPAELSGLKAGDCVLEVNGEDVIGLRITDIAKLAKAKSEHVTMLLWNTGWDPKCDPESLCCGPMPRSLQRLSVIVQSILCIIECPVCLDTIPPPAMQCQNGHLLCVNCRIRAEKCPVCRDRYTPRRALIAEQIYNAITNAFHLCRNEDKLRQKLFGPNATHPNPGIEIPTNVVKEQKKLLQRDEVNKSQAGVSLPRNKFLAKLLLGKACSMENLTTAENASTPMTTKTGVLKSGNSTPALLDVTSPAKTMSRATTSQLPTCSNQFEDMRTAENYKTSLEDHAASNVECKKPPSTSMPSPSSSPLGNTLPLPTSNVAQLNAMSKHFSLSTNDLSSQQEKHEHHHQLEPHPYGLACPDAQLIAIERCPSLQRLNGRVSSTMSMFTTNSVQLEGKSTTTSSSSSSTSSLLFLDKRRPCTSLYSSTECIRKRLHVPDVQDSKRPTSSNSSYSTSSSTSSGVFTSLDSSTTSTTPCKDELLSLLAPPLPEQAATSTFSVLQSSSSSSSSSPTSESSVELGMAPVSTSISTKRSLELSAPPPLSSVVDHSQPLNFEYGNPGRYRCPCNCGINFESSSQLQRHVKVVHQLAILSYGGASAQLALPLRQPVVDAVIILEIDNDSSDARRRRHPHPYPEIEVTIEGYDESVKSDDRAVQHNNKNNKEETKECWIRIEKLGQDALQASALLQATADESVDFMMETRLSRNEGDSDKEAATSTSAEWMDLGILEQRQETERIRSIVHSMETTTWQETFNQRHFNDNNNNNTNVDYKSVSDVKSESTNFSNVGNLSVISVIQPHSGIKDGDFLLKIDVRRRNENGARN